MVSREHRTHNTGSAVLHMIRSIAVVIAGYAVFAVSAVAFFAGTGRDPHAAAPMTVVIGSTVYGMLFAALGGWLAARFAGSRPMAHAIAVAMVIALGACVSIVASGATDTVWSQLSALLLMSPSAAIGGWLHSRILRLR